MCVEVFHSSPVFVTRARLTSNTLSTGNSNQFVILIWAPTTLILSVIFVSPVGYARITVSLLPSIAGIISN